MQTPLPSWLRWVRNLFRPGAPQKRRHLPLCVEELERRDAPTVSPIGPEFRVNTTTLNNQFTSSITPAQSVATDAAGDFVVTWSGSGVYAQRYNAGGVAQGGEFRVNTTTTGNPQYSAVAMDAAGDFVVTWTGDGIDAQRYNAGGVAQGGEFRVNTTTTGLQQYATVAMDAAGDFVITWSSLGQDGSGFGVYAQRYSAAGVAQGGEFLVNTTTVNDQKYSTVAMDAAGDFVVTWSSHGQDGSGYGIYAQRYSAAGLAQGGEFLVNTTTANNQVYSTVAMDAAGDFVVTWSSNGQDGSGYGIYAQRYSAAGLAQGGEFHVNTTTVNAQKYSTVAVDAAGDFVVTWSSNGQDGSGYGVYAQRYSAAGVAQGGEFRVNTNTFNTQSNSAVAVDAAGDFVVAWSSYGQDGSGYGVYAQNYTESAPTSAPPIVAQVFSTVASSDPGSQITAGSVQTNAVPGLLVVFSLPMATSGAGSVTNPANWQLTRNGIDISSQIISIGFAFGAPQYRYVALLSLSSPLMGGDYVLTARNTLTDAGGHRLDGLRLGNGSASDFTLAFTVGPVVHASGPEFRVNTTTANDQETSYQSPQAVATDAVGNFVVTWSSFGQDGSGWGVYAQRYNDAGVPQGGEFRVNSTTANNQTYSTVAMDAAGDFVITWSSNGQDGSGYGIYAQRYSAAGVAQGGEFRVNTTTTGSQEYSTVAMDAAGDFVVTWSSNGQDGSGFGVYAQRYSAAGVAQGGEFLVNTTTANNQVYSTVAMDAAGDFVITWSSLGQDGSGYGIYAQRYSAAGLAQGGEFRVNTTTTGLQQYSTVAMDAAGDFVVSWTSYRQYESGYGVYAQRYSAAGVAQGGEFQVDLVGNQEISTVAMDAAGDFVVTWSSFDQDGSGYGVYARSYNAAGVAQGSEFRVNTTTANNQQYSSVAMDAAGDFVVAWSSYGQDGSSYGVYAQRYSGKDTPVFSGLTGATITDGTATATLSGTLGDGNQFPPGNVSITVNGVTQTAAISAANGSFSLAFPTATLTAVGSPYTITFSYVGNANFTSATDTSKTLTVKDTPVFSGLTGATITYGTATATLSGTLAAGSQIPPGNVSITVNGVTQTAAISAANGSFSLAFPTATLTAVGSPYTITFSYVGNANFTSATDTSKTLTVQLALSLTPLPAGTAGTAYSQTITASGGTAPYSFAVSTGNLPTGLTLSSGGVLSGTTTAVGAFNFTVTATDASSAPGPQTGSQAYSLVINPGAPASVTAIVGTSQSTPVSAAFPAPIQVVLKDGAGNIVGAGIQVVFTASSNSQGAGATFPGGIRMVTATTNASGIATAPALTANATIGTFLVQASTAGVATPATFTLTNTPAGMPFTDNFSPAQGALTSANWQVLQGSFSQNGTQAVAGNSSPNNFAAYKNASAADVTVTDQNATVIGNGTVGLFARDSTDGYLAVIFNLGSTGEVRIFEITPGAYITLASAQVAQFTSPVALTFTVQGFSLQVFVNNHLDASILNNAVTAPGLAGIFATPGEALGTFSIAAAVPTVPFSDNFSPAQGALTPASWQVLQGGFSQNGTQAVASSAVNNFAAYTNADLADVSVSVQNATVIGNGTVGLFARNSVNGYLAVLFNSGGNGVVRIFEVTPNAYITLASAQVAQFTTALTETFTVVGNSLQVFVNGTLDLSILNNAVTGPGISGIFGTPGEALGTFTIAAAVPALPFSDNFSPAQGTLTPANWQVQTGGFSQNGTQAVASSAALNIATYGSGSAEDVSVSAQNVSVLSGGTVGLVARYTSLTSYYLATLSNSGVNGVVTLFLCTPTGFQTLTSVIVAKFTAPVTLTLNVQGTSLQVLVNGAVQASVLNTALTGPGLVGLWATSNELFGAVSAAAL